MNDFTKEELREIYHKMLGDYNPIKMELMLKIKSMIDNYCKHKPTNNNLLINPIKIPGKEKWDIIFRWEGLKGYRQMLLEIERDGFSLPRLGVEDIKRICEEFLNNEDRSHQYLRVSK